MSLPENFAVRPTTMDDLEAILALYNACSVEQVGKAVVDETELQMEWKMPTFDLGTDTRVVLAPDGTLVGHVAVWDGAPHVRLWADVRVHPEYKGRSIGTCLGQWAEERARWAIPKAPEGARVALRRGAFSTNTAAQTLLCQQDYQIVRYFLNMAIEMEESDVST